MNPFSETPDPFDRAPVETQRDLEELWRDLMSPLGFGATSLWLMPLAPDGRPLGALSELADLPAHPGRDGADRLGFLVRALVSDPSLPTGLRLAWLLTRPGSGVRDADRAWALTVTAAGRRAGVETEVVHLAHDHDVLPLPADELGLPASA